MIIADASVWIDYLGDRSDSPQARRLDALLSDRRFAVADLTITELLQGIRDEHLYQRTMFKLCALTTITVGGRDIAIETARNYRSLRARGITIRKTIATLIATRCIVDGHALLFSDRDFDPFVTHLGLISAMND